MESVLESVSKAIEYDSSQIGKHSCVNVSFETKSLKLVVQLFSTIQRTTKRKAPWKSNMMVFVIKSSCDVSKKN